MKARHYSLFLFAALLALACSPKQSNLPIMDKALHDKGSVYYADFASYPKNLASLPIGVFDSGTGGLTVLEKILERDEFKGERFLYLADQANMPYGRYDACGKSDYLRELVIKDALCLLKKPGVKIIVIACNTATAYGLGNVRSLLEQSKTGVKVIGVINAGVKATLDRLSDKNEPCAIGVLATPGAIASGAYERTIKEESAARGISGRYEVINQGGIGFAEAVDNEPDFVNSSLAEPRASYRGPVIGEGEDDIRKELLPAYGFDMNGVLSKDDGKGNFTEFQLNHCENYARFNLVSLIERHRKSGSTKKIRAIILGCTHYPFALEAMKGTIEHLRKLSVDGQYPYRDLLDDDLSFIDPATYTAMECYSTLKQDGNLAGGDAPASVEAVISVPAPGLDSNLLNADGSLKYDFKYGRNPGTEDITTVFVPFDSLNVDKGNRERIHRLLPVSYSKIEHLFGQ